MVTTWACPSSLPIKGNPSPDARPALAKLWRRSWMRTSSSPAFLDTDPGPVQIGDRLIRPTTVGKQIDAPVRLERRDQFQGGNPEPNDLGAGLRIPKAE